jgi:hypothetical protein
MLAGCTKEESIIYGLSMSGLVIRTPEVVPFYLESFAHHPEEFVTYKMLRKKGDLLTKSQLQLLGIRTNTKISRQFYQTLNDEGLLDPVEAAVNIAISISNAVCSRRKIHSLRAVMGPDQLLQAIPSNMAAGPCANSVKLSSLQLKASEAILFPLRGCDRQGQCGCLWTLASMQFDDMDHEPMASRLSLE